MKTKPSPPSSLFQGDSKLSKLKSQVIQGYYPLPTPFHFLSLHKVKMSFRILECLIIICLHEFKSKHSCFNDQSLFQSFTSVFAFPRKEVQKIEGDVKGICICICISRGRKYKGEMRRLEANCWTGGCRGWEAELRPDPPPPSPTTRQEYICTENLTIFAQTSAKTTQINEKRRKKKWSTFATHALGHTEQKIFCDLYATPSFYGRGPWLKTLDHFY